MKRIALIGCSKSKDIKVSPAHILYNKSTLFKKAYKFCTQSNYDKVYILSAKHYLITPTTVIEPYDKTLKRMDRTEKYKWSMVVADQIREKIEKGSQLDFHCGEEYLTYLIQFLKDEYKLNLPLEKLSIGKRLRWYNETLPYNSS